MSCGKFFAFVAGIHFALAATCVTRGDTEGVLFSMFCVLVTSVIAWRAK